MLDVWCLVPGARKTLRCSTEKRRPTEPWEVGTLGGSSAKGDKTVLFRRNVGFVELALIDADTVRRYRV
ncbi:hypothetical protein EYC80_005039 [Monilinia laxa]|uniref:Uncharacterized protein n=1 Tax=Monilinia laxa TaxID=61186 RepID=A0A5N6KIY6_MONLA|nr:hypothetical protein EYC80_005039 [Monilinia laxa]